MQKSIFDDLIPGEAAVEESQMKKSMAMEIFEDATFHLHKWHSKESEKEDNNEANDGDY